MQKILITGGAGFFGSHVVRLFVNNYPGCQIVNLDKLTYAGNLANLKDVKYKPNYTGHLKTTSPGLRQTNDLLSLVGINVSRNQGDIDYYDCR